MKRIFDAYPDEEFLMADGFEKALLGVVRDMNAKPRLAYSVSKCLEILIKRDGMDSEEAREFFDFNVSGAYIGEKTPIWVEDELLLESPAESFPEKTVRDEVSSCCPHWAYTKGPDGERWAKCAFFPNNLTCGDSCCEATREATSAVSSACCCWKKGADCAYVPGHTGCRDVPCKVQKR